MIRAKNREEGLSLKNDLIYKNDQLYVPETLIDSIIYENHGLPVAGHGGNQATLAQMHLFWWPSMAKTIKEFIEKCDT